MTPRALYADTMREKGRVALPWSWLTPKQQDLWRIRAEVRFGRPANARERIARFIADNIGGAA